jgi:hypothetical protein
VGRGLVSTIRVRHGKQTCRRRCAAKIINSRTSRLTRCDGRVPRRLARTGGVAVARTSPLTFRDRQPYDSTLGDFWGIMTATVAASTPTFISPFSSPHAPPHRRVDALRHAVTACPGDPTCAEVIEESPPSSWCLARDAPTRPTPPLYVSLDEHMPSSTLRVKIKMMRQRTQVSLVGLNRSFRCLRLLTVCKSRPKHASTR